MLTEYLGLFNKFASYSSNIVVKIKPSPQFFEGARRERGTRQFAIYYGLYTSRLRICMGAI